MEPRKGACSIRLTLQAEGEATLLARLLSALGWGVQLQPTTGGPWNPPVRAAEAVVTGGIKTERTDVAGLLNGTAGTALEGFGLI